jgi:phosphomannomutase
MSDVQKNRGLLPVIETFARKNTAPATIVFGTSGWRGEIGTDFTFNAVRIVTSALIEVFRTDDPQFLRALGVSDFEEVQTRGVIVGHDNRFLGREFAMEVIGHLRMASIRAWYAGEATTPEFSAGIRMLKAACSINLTPSHNPANYGGFKFNPSDGGPAGSEITARIEEFANGMMNESRLLPSVKPDVVEEINLIDLYVKYLSEKQTLDLGKIRDFVRNEDCLICVDHVHGATRRKLPRIIGTSSRVRYLRTEDNCLFGGVAPEPSVSNMEGVERELRESKAKYRLGAVMDPDGDRIRYADPEMQIPMNYFGAMALHFLHVYKGFSGVAVKSVGTSNLVNAIAVKLGIPVRETKVGFKNFRPFLLGTSGERAVIAFEESDGISGYNHTLEKDAIFGLLLAIEMMAVTEKSLSSYLHELMTEYGYYYPDRSGIEVERSLAGETLLRRLSVIKDHYREGSSVHIGEEERVIQEVITIDGIKLVFDDASWLMIRPSGTEPKVRFYIEARTEEGKQAMIKAAEKITKEAIGTSK